MFKTNSRRSGSHAHRVNPLATHSHDRSRRIMVPKPYPPVKRAHSSDQSGAFLLLKYFVCTCALALLAFVPYTTVETDRYPKDIWGITAEHLAESITSSVKVNQFPEQIELHVGNVEYDALVNYTIEPQLNKFVDKLLTKYKPDYAAVVAIKPETGNILAMSSFIRDGNSHENLALHSEFPAASLFKVITAVAVLDQGVATPKTKYKYNGKSTSLYKKNVLRHKDNKYTRTVELRQAFAVSNNTVFGKMGVFQLGGATLNDYASRFGFNKPLGADLAVGSSKTHIVNDDAWSIAETASGYTKSTTISPLHAAMVASTIVNDGVMPEPRIVNYAVMPNGPLLYLQKSNSHQVVSPDVAREMRKLMRATVRKGSAKKAFRGFFNGDYKNLDVGGKTGSLTGLNPKGRTEWFIAYGDSGKDKIAVATVIVNKKKWRVKPSYVVRKVIEEYFKDSATG